MNNPLAWLFFIPFIAVIVLLLLPACKAKMLKSIALILSLFPLFLLLINEPHWVGRSLALNWFSSLSIEFRLQIDALSLLFLYLTAFITPLSIASANSENLPYPRLFYTLIFFLQGLLTGFFASRDLLFFTFFWEAMLIPLYFLINLWGGELRQAAAIKFLIYMIAGSALLIAAVLSLYFSSVALAPSVHGQGSFNLDLLSTFSDQVPYARWLYAIFLLAFAVKTPLFPFHAWLPDTYCQASTPGTILLSALLSKAGIYGLLRIGVELFPSAMRESNLLLLSLAITGVLYGALAAWQEKDFKRLIAYSSLSHINFILAGLFIFSQTAHVGAIVQALNHGITIAALFLVAGWLECRIQSTAIGQIGGLAKFFPQLCWLTLFFVLSAVALPGMNNFIGEVIILFALFGQYPWLAFLLALSVILSVVYMLPWIQAIYFEEPSLFQKKWSDIKAKEMAIASPLIILIFWVGIYPAPLLERAFSYTSSLKSWHHLSENVNKAPKSFSP